MPFKTVSAKHHTLLALAWINPYFMRLSRQLAMQINRHWNPPCPPADFGASLQPRLLSVQTNHGDSSATIDQHSPDVVAP